jgi:RimJ/RimL family protein N-acetyltransferase
VDGPRVPGPRLRLDPISTSDLSALFPIFHDPDGWWYEPHGQHLDEARTSDWIRRAVERWSSDGLSYWTARRLDTAEVVGVGGVQRHASGSWNLFYRLATASWGHGYATELAGEAIAAAHSFDDGVPVIAWIAEHNQPSRQVAERVGLRDQGLRIDASDGRFRLAYADRDLPAPPA